MTDKQRKFADEYVIDCNATRAYKAAYPGIKKDGTAASAGGRLLRNVEVAAHIKAKLDEISNSKIADAREIEEYLTSVVRGESRSSEVVMVYQKAEVIKKPPGEKERIKAAELLGKKYKLFADGVNINSPVPVVISGGEEIED